MVDDARLISNYDLAMAEDWFMWRSQGNWFAYDCTTGATQRVMVVCERCHDPVAVIPISQLVTPTVCVAVIEGRWWEHCMNDCQAAPPDEKPQG